MESKIKVMVADDMEAHRRRLSRMIEKEPDFELIKPAESGYEAIMNAGIYHPEIILMDIEMENKLAGITAAQQINEKLPDIKIIILTVHVDDKVVFAAFQAGVVDYLVKTEDTAKIADAIRNAHDNLSPIRPMIASKIRNEFKKCKIREQSFSYFIKLISAMTTSEYEIFKMLYDGCSKKEIAQLRCVEYDTIKKQVNSILKKCEQPSTRQLIQNIKSIGVLEVFKEMN